MEKNKKKKTEILSPVIASEQALVPRFVKLSYPEMKEISAVIAVASARNLSKEEALLSVMRGQELGVGPVASLMTIYIIKGKTGLSLTYDYTLELALIRTNMPNAEIEWLERSNKTCKVRVRRNDKPNEKWIHFEHSHEDANKSGLLGKDNWKKYEKIMHITKVVHEFTNIIFSDVVYGIKDSPMSIYDWEDPIIKKITKPKKGKKKDTIDITPETETDEYDWGKMDETKKAKGDADKKTATEAFLKATKKSSKKGGLKLALTPKKPKEKTLKETLDEDKELQDNIDAIADVIDETNKKAFAEEDVKDPIVKPFNPKKKLGLKKKGPVLKNNDKIIDLDKVKKAKKEVQKLSTGILDKLTKKVLETPKTLPKKLKKEMVIKDAEWEEIPIIELLSYKYVEKFDLCHVKAKNKAKYDIITKGFIELIEAYFIMYEIDEGVPFEVKFKEIIQTKKKMQPVFAIYQKAFKETFPDEHYHDLMKGFYDATEEKIKELIATGEANVGKPGHEFWGGYSDTGYRPDHNIWIHEFLKKNNLFTVDDELVERISK